MRILILSDSESIGGAAVCASRLAESFCALGHEVIRFLPVRDRRQAPWQAIISAPSVWEKALSRILTDSLWYAIAGRQRVIELQKAIKQIQPDIINIHNLHSARSMGWSIDLVKTAGYLAPTVWTLHDMWSTTGGCAYSNNCTYFLKGCKQPCEWEKIQGKIIYNVSREWARKQDILANNSNIVAVAPSHWLAEEAKKGLWCRSRVEEIPYGLPTDTYLPLNKQMARHALGIDGDGPVLLVVAQRLNDPRKGLQIFYEALNLMEAKPLRVITMGDRGIYFQAEGVRVFELGWVDHERMKTLAYSAADIFVHTALADNLPNVILESFACGTPVVAFSRGGVPELVKEGVTGFISDSVSPSILAALLSKALAFDELPAMSNKCRQTVVKEYGFLLQAERYISLFSRLLAEH